MTCGSRAPHSIRSRSDDGLRLDVAAEGETAGRRVDVRAAVSSGGDWRVEAELAAQPAHLRAGLAVTALAGGAVLDAAQEPLKGGAALGVGGSLAGAEAGQLVLGVVEPAPVEGLLKAPVLCVRPA